MILFLYGMESAIDPYTIVTADPQQIAKAQENLNALQNNYHKVTALQGYSDVDIENVAQNVYERAKAASSPTCSLLTAIMNELTKENLPNPWGVSSTIEHAILTDNGKHKHVYARLQGYIKQAQINDSSRLIAGAKQQLNIAQQELE